MLQPNSHCKQTDGFSPEVDLHWKAEAASRDVFGYDWQGGFVAFGYAHLEDRLAAVLAVSRRSDELLREVVESGVEDNFVADVGLARLADHQCVRFEESAGIFGVGWASGALVAGLDHAISRAAIVVIVVAVIALQSEAFSIAADLAAELGGGRIDVFWSALEAIIATRAWETAIWAGQAFILLAIIVRAYIAIRSIVRISLVVGTDCDLFAGTLVLEVALHALTLTEFPDWIGFEVALVADAI